LAAFNLQHYQPFLADSLEKLGIQLLRAERLNTALSVQQEAVSIYQELEAVSPEKYRSRLIDALTRLAKTLAELKSRNY